MGQKEQDNSVQRAPEDRSQEPLQGGDVFTYQQRYTAEEWQQLWASSGIDTVLIGRIEQILGAADDTLSDEEHVLGAYYQYSLALGMRGVSLLDDPHLTAAERLEDRNGYDLGARMAVSAYLREHPEDQEHPVPISILDAGIGAPPMAHRLFFLKIRGALIMPFIRRHDPDFAALTAPDAHL